METINDNKSIPSSKAPEAEILNSEKSCFQHWLDMLCVSLHGTYAALLAVKSDDSQLFEPVALWPYNLPGTELFVDLVERTIADNSGLITRLQMESNSEMSFALSWPVKREGEVNAVVVLALTARNETLLKPLMGQLRWSSGLIEAFWLQEKLEREEQLNIRAEGAVELLACVLSEDNFDLSAMTLVTELASRMKCNLVSISQIKKSSAQICHLSFSAEFGKKMNLIRSIESAMDEAIDQKSRIIFPEQKSNGAVTMAHRALSEQQGHESLLTVPLLVGESCTGAVTLHRDGENPFTESDADYCESLLSMAAISLEDKRLNSRSLLKKTIDAVRTQLQRLFGKEYYGRKLAAVMVVITVALLSTVSGTYRLGVDAVLEASRARVIVAPFDGYIREAPVRGGDSLAEGDLIVQLDDSDLRLEQIRWNSQKKQLDRQYREAIARRDRAGANIIAARIDQANARLDLVNAQIARARQVESVGGRVISGDLSQRIGGAVSKGEELFKISPAGEYRISMKVPESRINDIATAHEGLLYLSALPDQTFPFAINRITPSTISEDGASFFTIEADIERSAYERQPFQLQPGMEGVGKIEMGQQLLISIWTRELLEWLRLKAWMWL